jgi:hypothetical protein
LSFLIPDSFGKNVPGKESHIPTFLVDSISYLLIFFNNKKGKVMRTMFQKIFGSLLIFILISSIIHAEGLNKAKPSAPSRRDYSREARLKESDEALEENAPPTPLGSLSLKNYRSATSANNSYTLDLQLDGWTSNIALEFPPARFSRTTTGNLETKPSLAEPDRCYGFWSSPNFTIVKPKEINNANSVTAYVEYSHTPVGTAFRIPTIRTRFNRADFLDAAIYLYDGRNLNPDGGTGVITCKFDPNSLPSDQPYFLSVDFISFDQPVDPSYTFTITKAYVVSEEYPAPPEFIIDGVWVETDEDAKAWINGYKIDLLTWCYDAAYNDQITVMIKIINEFRNEYDVYVWANDTLTLLNTTDTYQVAAAGRWACYLERDGDVKVWNPFTDELLHIKNNGYRIAGGGDDALLIWDWDDDLYVWISEEGLYKVEEDDIWFLCDTASTPVY